MTPYLATARTMFNQISGVKAKVSSSALKDLGFFRLQKYNLVQALLLKDIPVPCDHNFIQTIR